MIELGTKIFESYFTTFVKFARFYQGKVLFKSVVWHHSLQFIIQDSSHSGPMKFFDEGFPLLQYLLKEY